LSMPQQGDQDDAGARGHQEDHHQHGRAPRLGTPQQFSDFVAAETVKFAGIIKQEGLQMDVN